MLLRGMQLLLPCPVLNRPDSSPLSSHLFFTHETLAAGFQNPSKQHHQHIPWRFHCVFQMKTHNITLSGRFPRRSRQDRFDASMRNLAGRIKQLTKRRQLKQILEEVNEARTRFRKLNLLVMNAVLAACVHCTDMDLALNVFRDMSKQGSCGVNEFTFGILLKGLGEAQRVDEAYELLESIEKGKAPGNAKLTEWLVYTLVDAFVERGDVLRARGVLTRFRLLHSKSGTTFSYNLLIKGYARSENPLEALPLLQEISNQGLRPDRLTYNTVILACARARKMDIAMDILNKMKNEAGKLNSIELLPNVITYTTLLKGFEHDRNLDGVIRIVDEMRAERSCVLDRVAYSAIIDAFLACGSVSEAVKVFEELLEMSKSDTNFRPKTHVYLSLMRSFAKMGDVKMVQNLHARMVPECSGNPSPSLRAEADWLLIESAVCDNQLDLAKQILDNVLQKRIKLILSDRAYMTIVRLHAFSGFTDQRFQPKVFNKYSADDPVEKMMIPYLEAKPVPARLQLAKVVMRFYADDAVPVEDQWGQCIGIVYREDCKEDLKKKYDFSRHLRKSLAMDDRTFDLHTFESGSSPPNASLSQSDSESEIVNVALKLNSSNSGFHSLNWSHIALSETRRKTSLTTSQKGFTIALTVESTHMIIENV